MKRGDVLNLTNGVTCAGTGGLKARYTFEKGKGITVFVMGAMKPDGSLPDPAQVLGELGWVRKSEITSLPPEEREHCRGCTLPAEVARLRASEATWQECAADRERERDAQAGLYQGAVRVLHALAENDRTALGTVNEAYQQDVDAIVALRNKVERLSTALRMGPMLLKQLGGMLPGSAEIVRTVVEAAENALEAT
jgi:hypothetical protein